MAQTDEFPMYRVLNPVFFDDQLWPADAILTLSPDAWPNEQMEPLNEAARLRMQEYLPHTVKKGLADQVHDAMVNRPREPMVMPRKDTDVPLMGSSTQPGQKRRGRPPKIMEAKMPDPKEDPTRGKRIMGTVGFKDELGRPLGGHTIG